MNKIIIIGNLTKDPELKTTESGIKVCNFTVAVNSRRSGEDNTQYFNVIVWRELAEVCGTYLRKGRKVSCVGTIRGRVYQASDGGWRQSLEISATEVEFLSSRPEG